MRALSTTNDGAAQRSRSVCFLLVRPKCPDCLGGAGQPVSGLMLKAEWVWFVRLFAAVWPPPAFPRNRRRRQVAVWFPEEDGGRGRNGMIRGIGVDLCGVSRLRRSMENPRFLERVFSEEEIRYAMERSDPAKHLAAAFAAKESFAKAGGWGLAATGLRNVCLRRTETGPVLLLASPAQNLLARIGAHKCWVSISHDGDYAVAMVVLEG